ncbi:response regulator [Paludibacterium yongneupense]|uniref:response regulator n=1 Tax=Paludibacterium yongneupense TaxID=400061 RepID=UPI00042842A3|nr:response regulator [Paludibacterium yongneupense]
MAYKLLLVDDEPFNLELMSDLLQEVGYLTVHARDGTEAWAILEQQGEEFAAVLLDKMMPGIGGMEVLKRIKSAPRLEFLPVIMQTAVGTAASVQEGLSAGAFYYLTKPFSREILLAVVNAAVSHWDRHAYFREIATQQIEALHHLDEARFSFRTLKEAQQVTALLAQTCPTPERVATGLFELLVNAIEHGNLELSYEEKSRLQEEGRWEAELEHRLAGSEFGKRHVCVELLREPGCIRFTIIDQGQGFDWQDFAEANPTRLIDSHGRGILIARKLAFDHLEYSGRGNRVSAIIKL